MKMKKKGFSLIEFLISSSLILFLIAGTAQLLGLSLAAKRSADFHFRAARLASSRLEHFKALPHDSAELEAGAHEAVIVDPSSSETYQIAWQVQDVDQTLKKVVLQFSSPSKSRRKAVFCLLLCRELEF
jgi:prepilin-type N-terminal cleavage/methylation domain-containing protein